jgi:Protein of unknown function (DUF2971)
VIDRLNAIVEPLYEPKPSGTLYHYTSLDAIQEILQEGGLWATDIHYFNDSAELNHTAALLSREIRRRLVSGEGDRTVLGQLLQWVDARVANGHAVFVASLTSNGNLLSQWRSYCSYGKGVSLGFPATHVLDCGAEQSYLVGQCIYDTTRQHEIIQSVIDAVEESASARGPAPRSAAHPSESYHPAFAECEDAILRIAAIFKHSAFQEEAEWRCVSFVVADYVRTDIRYRPGRSTLIPYKLFKLVRAGAAKIVLERVFVGPTANVNLSMKSLGQLLSRSGVRAAVVNSGVPHRET